MHKRHSVRLAFFYLKFGTKNDSHPKWLQATVLDQSGEEMQHGLRHNQRAEGTFGVLKPPALPILWYQLSTKTKNLICDVLKPARISQYLPDIKSLTKTDHLSVRDSERAEVQHSERGGLQHREQARLQHRQWAGAYFFQQASGLFLGIWSPNYYDQVCNTVYEEVCEAAQPTYGGGRGGHINITN